MTVARSLRWLALGCASALAFACAPEKRDERAGQLLLYVDTDAPVATLSATARRTLDEPAPLFDRVRLEVFLPGSDTPCGGCVNEFALDAARLSDRSFSVGVVAPVGAVGVRAKVQMFNSAHAAVDGTPARGSTVEAVLALPAVEKGATTEVSVVLPTDSVGSTLGSLAEPVSPTPGRPAASLVGTWAPAARVPCSDAPRPGEVCVPGGAFWLGGVRGPWYLAKNDTHEPRLVVLSPFFVDATEVTVRAIRSARGLPPGVTLHSPSASYCTVTSTPGPYDNLPANCVTWPVARAYCQQAGGDLTSEAQYEYIASGLSNYDFPWGNDEPACEDAVSGRIGYGSFTNRFGVCKPPEPPGGALPPGHGARDRLALPTGEIVDLAGNVAEHMLDGYEDHAGPCWAQHGVRFDPVCNPRKRSHVAKGGDWAVTAPALGRTRRFEQPSDAPSNRMGFRCARTAH